MRRLSAGARAPRPRARAAGDFINPPPLGLGTSAEIAVDRIGDDPPLRTRADDAERLQPRLHIAGQADAQLWIVLHLLALFGAGRRTPNSPVLLRSLGFHAYTVKPDDISPLL